jgi:drug/metabolite transporter superfamily protein YnfA
MSRKTLIYIGATVGSIIGGYLPTLWGASDFSGTAILLGTVGGVAGAILAYKIT